MNLIDAFLLCTALCYFSALVMPEAVTRNIKQRWRERIFMLLCGLALVLNIIMDNDIAWFGYAVWWASGAVANYLGYIEWKLRYEDRVSHVHQVAMCFWDLLITICCLSKIPFLG